MRVYEIATGRLFDETPFGLSLLARGHSGFEGAMDLPTAVGEKDVGPIPPGVYTIGVPYHHPHLGPMTMDLTPVRGTDTRGRGDFRIHGFGSLGPAESSHGCLLFGPQDRENIAKGNILLTVVSRLTLADVMI